MTWRPSRVAPGQCKARARRDHRRRPTGSTSAPEPGAGIREPGLQQHARLIHIDVPVRGILAAQLFLRVPADEDENLARTAGKRSVDIWPWACCRDDPGLREVAGAALIRAIDSGSQPWRLQQLASAAENPVAAPLVAVVVRRISPNSCGQPWNSICPGRRSPMPPMSTTPSFSQWPAWPGMPRKKAGSGSWRAYRSCR